jgi:hypothetical protein
VFGRGVAEHEALHEHREQSPWLLPQSYSMHGNNKVRFQKLRRLQKRDSLLQVFNYKSNRLTKRFFLLKQDFTRVLLAGYVNFQYVTIALEFVLEDINSSREEDYIKKEGRFWHQTLQASLRVVKSTYLALK